MKTSDPYGEENWNELYVVGYIVPLNCIEKIN